MPPAAPPLVAIAPAATPPDTAVAIVGAGAAGIAASLTLQAHGIPFRLIEARAHTGGRTWTTTTPAGHPFDQGASWIHAVDDGNPFAELAMALRAGPLVDERRRVLLDSRGARLDPAAALAFQQSRENAIARIVEAPSGASLAEAIDTFPPGPSGLSSSAGVHWTFSDPWAWSNRTYAGPWLLGADCALSDAADWAAARAGTDWLLPKGYGTLVQELAAGLPVTTGCALESLRVGAHDVELATSRGRFTAAHIVLTVPLGVLATERITFDPPLSATWRQALNDLPMGCLMKIGIDLLADPLDEVGSYYLHYPARDETAVLYFFRPAGHAMLYAFVGGSHARELEAADDATVRDSVLQPLREILGNAVVERSFGACVVTRWAADPFALGSYAVARPGGAGGRAVLGDPLCGRVHLAGEATAPDGWHGTAGGAWLAGRSVAGRLAAAMGAAGL